MMLLLFTFCKVKWRSMMMVVMMIYIYICMCAYYLRYYRYHCLLVHLVLASLSCCFVEVTSYNNIQQMGHIVPVEEAETSRKKELSVMRMVRIYPWYRGACVMIYKVCMIRQLCALWLVWLGVGGDRFACFGWLFIATSPRRARACIAYTMLKRAWCAGRTIIIYSSKYQVDTRCLIEY